MKKLTCWAALVMMSLGLASAQASPERPGNYQGSLTGSNFTYIEETFKGGEMGSVTLYQVTGGNLSITVYDHTGRVIGLATAGRSIRFAPNRNMRVLICVRNSGPIGSEQESYEVLTR